LCVLEKIGGLNGFLGWFLLKMQKKKKIIRRGYAVMDIHTAATDDSVFARDICCTDGPEESTSSKRSHELNISEHWGVKEK
jgi:hypothetical protein